MNLPQRTFWIVLVLFATLGNVLGQEDKVQPIKLRIEAFCNPPPRTPADAAQQNPFSRSTFVLLTWDRIPSSNWFLAESWDNKVWTTNHYELGIGSTGFPQRAVVAGWMPMKFWRLIKKNGLQPERKVQH